MNEEERAQLYCEQQELREEWEAHNEDVTLAGDEVARDALEEQWAPLLPYPLGCDQ